MNKKYLDCEKDWNKIRVNLKTYDVILKQFDEDISESLTQTNMGIIKKICEMLNIITPIVSDFDTTMKSTERIIELCKFYKCDKYLSGTGGKNYLDTKLLESNGIEVLFQNESTLDKKPMLEILKERI